ncbi:helix-turn-helix domain-containing protein [Desulforamulus ruminis]|uniref:Helix-turn-helix domain protein n=1 Tax=Desulforamulus ruminis (strain ATCC 23193 / DSM 2154 / NCIMB 8452 / DL) TaxID=696281 RepID=F6DM01_DESRL|nr:helix-turn-helix transcriptional regulator [Desulforamulus ruminis]AEG59343.1 helix-turn-helix domain protein [Desulforamulus ruminis DSM 2154]
MQYSEFGLKARRVMLQKKISGAAIARQLGVSTSYVSEILKGTRSGNGRKEQIAEILGLEEELKKEAN